MAKLQSRNDVRLKRHARVRRKISGTPECPRLNVFRSNAHIHAQIIDDVNGVTLPNKEVSCSSGSDSLTKNNCVVKNDAKHLTDIYPIRFHDGVVETSTAGGRYVLNTTK